MVLVLVVAALVTGSTAFIAALLIGYGFWIAIVSAMFLASGAAAFVAMLRLWAAKRASVRPESKSSAPARSSESDGKRA